MNGWTQSRMRGFRNTHGITVYRDGEWAERGELTLPEAARMLNLSPLTVLRQIRAGVIPAKQYCAGALGNQTTGYRRSARDRALQGALQKPVIIKSKSKDLCLSIT